MKRVKYTPVCMVFRAETATVGPLWYQNAQGIRRNYRNSTSQYGKEHTTPMFYSLDQAKRIANGLKLRLEIL